MTGLFEEMDSLHHEHLPDLFRRVEGPPREESFISGLIRNPEAGVFVAEMGARIVGLLVVFLHKAPSFPFLVPLHYAMIDSVVVTSSARGYGIGHALMAYTEAWARDRGVNRMELNVFEFNKEALSFYLGMDYSVLSHRLVKHLDIEGE
jgi:diamine N-acetyltransferase